MEYKTFELTVRHGGDPLIAAINLTPVRGSFNFGDPSKGMFLEGLIFLIASSCAIVACSIATTKRIWEESQNDNRQGPKQFRRRYIDYQKYIEEASMLEEEEEKVAGDGERSRGIAP
jgi:hypothetical protein